MSAAKKGSLPTKNPTPTAKKQRSSTPKPKEKEESSESVLEYVETNIHVRHGKRGDVYYITLRSTNADGSESRKFKRAYTLEEARRILAEHEAKKTLGQLPTADDRISLGDYADVYIDSKRLAQTTINKYNSIKNRLRKYPLGKKSIASITAGDINKYISALINSQSLCQNSINKDIRFIGSLFTSALESGIVVKNPMYGVQSVKKTDGARPSQKAKAKQLTDDEISRLVSGLEQESNYVLKAVVILGLYCGLRRGEICGLEWVNVDFEKAQFRVLRTRTQQTSEVIVKGTKTESSMNPVPMADSVISFLRDYQQWQFDNRQKHGAFYDDSPWVLVDEYGRPPQPKRISDVFSEYAKRQNVQATLHDLRHSLEEAFYDLYYLGVNFYDSLSEPMMNKNFKVVQKAIQDAPTIEIEFGECLTVELTEAQSKNVQCLLELADYSVNLMEIYSTQ